MKKIRIVAISDTHEQANKLRIPECDILIHAGDITGRGSLYEVARFSDWCVRLYDTGNVKDSIVVIAGNHDITAQTQPYHFKACLDDSIIYLEDSMVEVGQYVQRPISIYGAPWTPSFFREHWAFNADRGAEIRGHWDKIKPCDILVTHGPPYGVCDKNLEGEHVGCADLRAAILRLQPKIHICGHIHEGYGLGILGKTLVMNASSCTRRYTPDNTPLVLDIDIESF